MSTELDYSSYRTVLFNKILFVHFTETVDDVILFNKGLDSLSGAIIAKGRQSLAPSVSEGSKVDSTHPKYVILRR